jgi:hypothetical protein
VSLLVALALVVNGGPWWVLVCWLAWAARPGGWEHSQWWLRAIFLIVLLVWSHVTRRDRRSPLQVTP